jgi:hypothetical protein
MALTQSHYRFGVDSGTESTHTWHAAENTTAAIPVDTTFLLRFNVQATGGVAHANIVPQFQYNLNGAGWANITTTSSVARAVAAVALTNGGNCTKRLSGTGTFETTGAGQTEDGLSGGTANDIAANGCSETECGLILRSADLVNGDVVQFRVATTPTAITTYAQVPQVTVEIALPEITGSLSRTLASATLSSSAAAPVAGSLSRTLAGATLGASASAPATGVLTRTLGATTLSSTGTVEDPSVSASLTTTLGNATCSALGTAPVRGTLARTLASTTLASTSTAPITGALARTLGSATCSSTAQATCAGAIVSTLAPATLTSSGTAPIRGTLSRFLDDATPEASNANVPLCAPSALVSLTLGF